MPHGVPSPCGHSYMVCATVCLTVMPSFSDNYRPRFLDRQKPHLLISHRAVVVRRQHYRLRIKSQTTDRSVVVVEPTTFRTAATNDDKE